MFKKLFKKVKDIAGDISPYSGLIASAFGLGPLYSTLIGAGVPLLAGKGGKEALAGGIGGYFGGKTFGSKAAGTYVSPMEILAGKNVNFGGTGGMQSARDIAFERLKDAASFSNLDDKNPFKYAPGVFGALGFAGGLGAFDQDPLPEIAQFQYNPDDNPFIGVNEKYISDAQSAMQPNEDVFEFLKRIGRLPTSAFSKDGNRMKFETGRSTGATAGMPVKETPSTQEKITQMVTMTLRNPNRAESREFQFNLTTQEKDDIAKSIARDLGISSDSTDFENIYSMVIDADQAESIRRKTSLQAFPQFLEMFGIGKADGGGISNFAQGGMPMLDGPNVVGGDVINPMGGRIMGQGAGREDLLDGKIVDPITGRTQDIMVSNNEHVIPEYSLFALGGGDTEKGQQMMDNLREKTRPMAEQMGYDFQGAEDGSMNYAPVLAKEGKETAMSVPSMNIQEIIQKMMAQGKSIQEIMAIMSKLNTGMPKQKRPMMAQDGAETSVPNKGSRLSTLEYPKNFKGSFFGGGANMSTYDDFQDPVTFGPGRSPTIIERLMNKQGVGFNPKGVVKDPEEFNVSGLATIMKGLEDAKQIDRMIS